MPTSIDPDQPLPAGDYAIVEALGHRTFVGRVAEVERFGTKMLQIEPLYQGWMLGPVLLGGGSIYQFTPCAPAVAWARRAKYAYDLPPSVMAIAEGLATPAPAALVDYGADQLVDEFGADDGL